MCGANWRTRYFAVRAHRLHEEHTRGNAELLHCPTGEMVADCLTKLASAVVIEVLYRVMEGDKSLTPLLQMAHQTSVSPGKQNRSDNCGDGPSPDTSKPSDLLRAESALSKTKDPLEGLNELDVLQLGILEKLFTKFEPGNLSNVSELSVTFKNQLLNFIRTFALEHKISSEELSKLIHSELATESTCAPASKKRKGKARCRLGPNDKKRLKELESS